MGLDIYLSSPGVGKNTYGLTEDVPSEKYPDHLCKRNYLRSSYNGSGFNSVVGSLLEGRDLYWIFAPMLDANPEGYTFHPTKAQLREARERAVTLVDDLRGSESLGVSFISSSALRPDLAEATSDESAIAIYRKEVERHTAVGESPFGGSYSNAFGEFYLDEPIRVRALIPGKGFRGDGVYVIHERTDHDWYVQAAEIVVEFIDYALSQKRPTVRWSG